MRKQWMINKLPLTSKYWGRPFTKEMFDINDYVSVWMGATEDFDNDLELCEFLYEEFNLNHPYHYCSGSMMVGDVIKIRDGHSKECKYYYCNSVGFIDISNEVD